MNTTYISHTKSRLITELTLHAQTVRILLGFSNVVSVVYCLFTLQFWWLAIGHLIHGLLSLVFEHLVDDSRPYQEDSDDPDLIPLERAVTCIAVLLVIISGTFLALSVNKSLDTLPSLIRTWSASPKWRWAIFVLYVISLVALAVTGISFWGNVLATVVTMNIISGVVVGIQDIMHERANTPACSSDEIYAGANAGEPTLSHIGTIVIILLANMVLGPVFSLLFFRSNWRCK